jgi:hypothetical protein
MVTGAFVHSIEYAKIPGTAFKRANYEAITHLRIFQAQFLGEFLAIRFADVFLQLEPLLESASLQIRENRPSHHPATGFSARVRRPWKNQTSPGKIADATLNGPRKHGASAGCSWMMTSGPGTSNYRSKMRRDII